MPNVCENESEDEDLLLPVCMSGQSICQVLPDREKEQQSRLPSVVIRVQFFLWLQPESFNSSNNTSKYHRKHFICGTSLLYDYRDKSRSACQIAYSIRILRSLRLQLLDVCLHPPWSWQNIC